MCQKQFQLAKKWYITLYILPPLFPCLHEMPQNMSLEMSSSCLQNTQSIISYEQFDFSNVPSTNI